MKTVLVLFLALTGLNALANRAYPLFPDARLTPGSLCQSPSTYRYPERIAYCERLVNTYDKELVFIAYRRLGFSLSGQRNQYKVDHLIPLCAGGSNDITNLWPQYYTISALTDPLEPLACEILAKGKITQQKVIELILKAKKNKAEIPVVMKQLQALKKTNRYGSSHL